MPRPAALVCLIAALTAPLLHQGEAAGDLARWLAGVQEVRGDIDPIDDGVGDEPYVASAARVGTDAASAPAVCPTPGTLDALPTPAPLPTPVRASLNRGGAASEPSSAGRSRHAWLQQFRF